MKTFLSILCSILFVGAYAQEVDSLTSAIQTKIKSEILSQLKNQGVFGYQNKRLPKFKLKKLNGDEFDSESLIGKITVLNFWFTTCSPCIEEIPMLNKIQSDYSGRVNFVAITYMSASEITTFLKRKPFNFIQLVDGEELFQRLDVKTCPRTLITNENFIISYIDQDRPKDLDEFEYTLRNQIDNIEKR